MLSLLQRHFPGMRFSWHALLWAPLITPLVVVACFALGASKPGAAGFFVIVLIFGCGVSFGSTVALLLPALCVLSLFTRLTLWKAGLLGAVLAVIPYLGIAHLMWSSSGRDSGPPDGPFLEFLLRDWNNIILWSCLAAGAITAAAFYGLSSPVSTKPEFGDRSS